ncbi:PAS domain S-box protein [Natrononativus amylolyticus]|uniref:PAS domain S-box protein n=1 Tax=Natrononativus amylolyticus TaxID=2963434 RepID=UPI0020CCB158|nr:PAS domain S-box protein [Natrononativus amylolyticus]
MATEPHIVCVDPAADGLAAAVSAIIDATAERVESVTACLEALERADCVVWAGADSDRGLEFCSLVRARRSNVPVVLFPTDGSEALAGSALAAGAAGYVPRGQGISTLAARIDGILDGAEPGREPAASSAARLELLVEQVPLAVIEWNLEFEVVAWNPAATDLFGYTTAEATEERATDLLVPESERETVLAAWEALVGRGESTLTTNRNRRKDGTEITCEWINTPLVEDGEVISVLSIARDVTRNRKRASALEALQGTGRALMRANTREEIAEIVVTATEEVIEQPRAAVRLATCDGERLIPAALSGELREVYGDLPPIEAGDGLLWDAYSRQEPAFVEALTSEHVPYDLDEEVGNTIVCPLGTHGLLTVASPRHQRLETVDRHLVTVLATTAEAALDSAERDRELEQAKTILETVGDSVYALDIDGRFVTVNETLTSLTGYDREELVGEHATTVLTEASVERATLAVRELLVDGIEDVVTYELEVVGRAGEAVPCEVTTTLLRSDGEISGSVGVIRDVRERKRMERELVEQKRKTERLHDVASRLEECRSEREVFEVTIAAAEDVLQFDVCVVDRARGSHLETVAVSSTIHDDDYTNRTSVNDGLAGLAYRTGETSRVADLTDHERAEPERESYRSALTVPIAEYGIFQAVSNEVGAFDAADQELTELLLSHVVDALDRMAFETQLTAERDRFVALFENVPDAVVSSQPVDGEPVIERVNPAFERIFGYAAEDVVGRRLDSVIVPPERRADAEEINRRVWRGETVETEVKRRTADGLREFMMRLVPMDPDRNGDRAFGLYTDVTEQKQRQKRLEVLNRVLRHDLRNGMNIIDGYAQTLATIVDDDVAAEYVEPIHERADELLGLAEKTRAVERTLETAPVAGPVDVVERAAAAIDDLDRAYPDADISRSLPERATVRSGAHVETAVRHVLENAIEHADSPSPRVDVTLRVLEDALEIRIADDGPGIPEDERALLEEDREITQLRHASGLGLWLANWAVVTAGGELGFEPNEPRGTVVRLTVPVADRSDE